MTEKYVIDTSLGRIRGKHAINYLGEQYYSFQGIPYAKAPVGNLRFKAPQPIEAFNDVFDATEEGPACPSMHSLFLRPTGNEDNCLNLNIYIKELPKSGAPLKPVMVWIHGGGFIFGSNSTVVYSPEYLMTEDVIQVAINYRLGIFGFLCLEDESLGVTGNAGLKDQVMALQWVRNNISSFGGDPNNVTLYGQSAGGASVHYLVLSPKAKGLFQKVIVQSGSVLSTWAYGRRGAKSIKKHFNISEDNEAKILDILQNMTSKQLLICQNKVPDLLLASHQRPFGPVVENPSNKAFLSEEPLQILKSGTYSRVPMMLGMTTNEGLFHEIVNIMFNINRPFDCANEIPFELEVLSNTETTKTIVSKIREFYKLNEEFSEEKTTAVKSDNLFNHSIHRSLNYHLKSNNDPIYYYIFSFEGNFNHTKNISTSNYPKAYFICRYLANFAGTSFLSNIFAKMANGVGFRKIAGSSHADEVWYLFGSILSRQMDKDSREEKTMKRMVKLWTNFAKYGHPTPKSAEDRLGVHWLPAEKHQHHFLNIGDELTMGVNPFKDRNKFWDEIFEEYSKK